MGDPAVGKSALTQMFASNGQRFPKVYNMTCGVDLQVKPVKIPDTEEAVELHIFDTAGQVRAASLARPCACPCAATSAHTPFHAARARGMRYGRRRTCSRR